MIRLGTHMGVRRRICAMAAAAGFAMVAAGATAGAQQPAPKTEQKTEPAKPDSSSKAGTNAVGVGSAWKADIKESPNTSGQALDAKQMEIIKRVDTFFNEMGSFQGRFVQTSADKKQVKGKFYVQRPGKFRFNYAPPSRLVILSDGKLLSIEDHDLKTVDRYPLESTPFRLLMKKEVNLSRDARIVDLQEADDLLVVAVIDKGGDSAGALKLYFTKQPALELKEWVITDAQGLDTRIEVADLDRTQKADEKLFVGSNIGMPGVSSATGN